MAGAAGGAYADGIASTAGGAYAGGIAGAAEANPGAAFCTGAPHMSQKALSGSSAAPQFAQTCPPGGGATAIGTAGALPLPREAPQLLQNCSPGATCAPQTGHSDAITVGIPCAAPPATGGALKAAPHSSQKAAPSGCRDPQVEQMTIASLLYQ